MALVSSIFNVLNDTIKSHNISRVNQVKLIVGEMTGVEDMTMSACFEIFAEATPVEGARLVIERVPIKVKCLTCGNEFTVSGWSYKCPECSNTGTRIISGKELFIESIEAE